MLELFCSKEAKQTLSSYKVLSFYYRLPEQYASLKLPHKLPPTKDNLSLTSLPMLGYMEQTVATALIKAMTAAGNAKPKYPFLSTSRSALFYIAYHLKGKVKYIAYFKRGKSAELDRCLNCCVYITLLADLSAPPCVSVFKLIKNFILCIVIFLLNKIQISLPTEKCL